MERNDCLITGAETIDSNTLNRCLYNLYSFAKEKATESIGSTSENYPDSPFYLDGYSNALEDHPVISKYNLSQANSSTEGVVSRLYCGSPSIDSKDNVSTVTETATGMYQYTESVIRTFVPTVKTLFSETSPCVFSSILGDDTTTSTTGTSAVGSITSPTIKFTSYLLCGYTGVSFGTITFKKMNGDVQENTISLNIARDLINLDNVDKIKFFSVSNGMNSGVRSISENGDVVSDISACNVTYTSDTDVVISNITKNDSSDSIRVDKLTGRILDSDEIRDKDDYVELDNDEYSLNFFVVFDMSSNAHTFDESTWCFYVTTDAAYAKSKLNSADSYARNNTNIRFLGFEAADDGYEDTNDTHTYTQDGRHVCHNAVTTARDAFNGCYNATFPLLCYFSNELKYADRMFKGCSHAIFSSLPETLEFPKIKTAASMFEGCTTATFTNVRKIKCTESTQLKRMFAGCSNANFSALSSLELNGNCGSMFLDDYYSRFESLKYITGNIQVINSMFEGCKNAAFNVLEKIESSSTNVVTTNKMFYGLVNPTFEYLNNLNIGTNGYNSVSMFEGCSNASFAALTEIGNPINATAMFKDCDNDLATFQSLSGLGEKINNGTSMFESCTNLSMTLTADANTLVTAKDMFKNVYRIQIDGDMNGLTLADGMFSDDWTAIVNGDMTSLHYGRQMFEYCGTAYVYGSMESLVDADRMFYGVTDAYMKELPSSVENMSSMFANTSSSKVSNYIGSENLRFCTAAFQNSSSVEITGDIFAGSPYTMQSMFEATTGYSGPVSLCNPTMSGYPEDADHRYYSSSFITRLTVETPHSDSEGSSAVVYGGDYTAQQSGVKNSAALVIHTSDHSNEFTVYNFVDGQQHAKTVEETDFNYEYKGRDGKGQSGKSYLVSSVDVVSEAPSSNVTDWIVYTKTEDGLVEDDFFYTVSRTPISEVSPIYIKQFRKTDSSTPFHTVKISLYKDPTTGKYSILINEDPSHQIKIDTSFDTYNLTLKIIFTETNSLLEPVFYIYNKSATNAYYFHRSASTTSGYHVEPIDYENPPKPVYDESETPDIARVYQLYKDIGDTQKYAFLVVDKKEDFSRNNYLLFSGSYLDESGKPKIYDANSEQGDIYTIRAIFDGSEPKLDDPEPIVEVELQSSNAMNKTLLYADSMFHNVVSTSCLSGYDDVIPLSLVDAGSMFALDEKVEDDDTFEHVGNIFKNMDRSGIQYADKMFKNRYFMNSYPFAFFETHSFMMPPSLIDATEMFHNAEIHLASNAEIGFNLPTTLTKAVSAFCGYSGGLIRFAQNTIGEVYANDALECECMFMDCKFANSEANKYTFSIPSMKLPMFEGSDFAFDDITSINDRSGIYYQYDFDLEGKFITEYAALGSLTDDISKWFDEGIYLASILCPPDNNYRLQTNVYELATISTATSAYFRELLSYTNRFTGKSITSLGHERMAFMFSPALAIGLSGTLTEESVKIANRMTEFDSASSAETALSDIRAILEDENQKCYSSISLDSLSKIDSVEAPFAFAGVKNTSMNNLTDLTTKLINGTGMFFRMPLAEFNNLTTIDIKDGETKDTFKSSFIDISKTTDYVNNYNDMFRENKIATFYNLDTINVKSRFFKLCPTSGSNMLFIKSENNESAHNTPFGKRICFVTTINGVKRTVRIVIEQPNPSESESRNYFIFLYDENMKEYTVTDVYGNTTKSCIDTGILGGFNPGLEKPGVKYDFAELNRTNDDSELNYVFNVILTVTNNNSGVEEKDRVKYYTITYNANNEPVFTQHAKYPTTEEAYGELHNPLPIIDGDTTVYSYKSVNHDYNIYLSSDDKSSMYTLNLANIIADRIVSLDTGLKLTDTFTSFSMILMDDIVDGTDYLAVNLPDSSRLGEDPTPMHHYLYHINKDPITQEEVGVIEEHTGIYIPTSESYDTQTIEFTKTYKPQAFSFGRNKQYQFELMSSTDETYKFEIMKRESTDVMTLITDVPKTTLLECIDVYEKDEFTKDVDDKTFVTNIGLSDDNRNAILRDDTIDGVEYFVISIQTGGDTYSHFMYHVEPDKTVVIENNDAYEPHAVGMTRVVDISFEKLPYSFTFENKLSATKESYVVKFEYTDDILNPKYKFTVGRGVSDHIFIMNFYGSGINYYVHADGRVSEQIIPSVTVRYKMHLNVSDAERFGTEGTAYCTNMFKDCESATFSNLKMISIGAIGSCAGLFSGCKNAVISNLEVLYLPKPPQKTLSDGFTTNERYYANPLLDRTSNWYADAFSGIKASNLDFSKLTKDRTNIHELDNNMSLGTDGNMLFRGILDSSGKPVNHIDSAESANTLIKLPLEIGRLMYWGTLTDSVC